jgi:hypothetical protein
MSGHNFNTESSDNLDYYVRLYQNIEDDTGPLNPQALIAEYDLLNAAGKQTLMNQLPTFKNFFHSSLAAQNETLVKTFGEAAHSDNFTQEALNTSIPAPYLSFLFGLLARTLHVSYATVCSSFPNNEAWEGESIDAELFGSQRDTGLIQDSDDEILEFSPAYAHLSPSNTHRTMESIPNTSDHMIVDPPPRKRKVPS